MNKKTLAILYPELVKQWHSTKNGELTPYDVTAGSKKKVWWQCPKATDHVWEAAIYSRTSGGMGCPCCSNYKVVRSNCLATTHPKMAKQWHPTKNGELTPYDVTAGSGKKVWWKCPKATDHEWEIVIRNRFNGNSNYKSNCPFCSGKRTALSNCLITTHPKIAKQWHPTKNGELTSYDVTAGSNKLVWWQCGKIKGHEWKAAIYNRTKEKGTQCPFCTNRKVTLSNSLATTHPEVAKQWHPGKNGVLSPCDVTAFSGMRVWWKCPKANDHVWKATIASISSGRGCPCCHGLKVVLSNCLATTHPEIAKEWHPTKNGDFTSYNVTAGSKQKVWWKCSVADDHEWITTVSSRKRGEGCACCAGKNIVLSNCLATICPEILKLWHPSKNKKLTPYNVTVKSGKKVWWKCPKVNDHEWEASIANVVNGSGCPCCHGLLVVKSNCLATTHPEIAKEWHPTKNGNITSYDIIAGSGRKHWWICDKGHEYIAVVNNRKKGAGCPICSESKGEKIIRRYLKEHKINHETQYSFKNSKIKRSKFDFAISNSAYTGLIEYHGEQHYIPVSFGSKDKFAAEKNLLINIKNDDKKITWCKNNKIPLFIIPYWEKNNIENILNYLFSGKKIVFVEPKEIAKNKTVRTKIRKLLKINYTEQLHGEIVQHN